MNSRDLIFISLITLCITGLLIALIFGGASCEHNRQEYRKAVYTKCLEAGKEPLACKALVDEQ